MGIYTKRSETPIEKISKQDLYAFKQEIENMYSSIKVAKDVVESMSDDANDRINKLYDKMVNMEKRMDSLSYIIIDIQNKLENKSGQ